MSTTLKKPTSASFRERIARIEADPVSYLFGEDLGTAKLIRNGQSFRIFFKKIEDSKSGKAQLVKLTVFMTDEHIHEDVEPYTYIEGTTYLPNFVIEKKMVYWILQKKIYNISFRHDIGISESYVPRGHKIYNPIVFSTRTPEVRANEFLSEIKEYHKDWEQTQ